MVVTEIRQALAQAQKDYERTRSTLDAVRVDRYHRILSEAKDSEAIARQEASAESRERRRKAVELIQSWLDDESGHDERLWPVLEKELLDSRLRCRE